MARRARLKVRRRPVKRRRVVRKRAVARRKSARNKRTIRIVVQRAGGGPGGRKRTIRRVTF